MSPEGLIYQLIVRLHRFSLGRSDPRQAVHWRGGVVLDYGKNGRALVTVVGQKVQVQVRAGYPHFFLGYIVEEVLYLVRTFWRGLEAKKMVPCLAPCPTPGTGFFDIEELQLTRQEGMPKVYCPSCKTFQAIDPLLLGVPRQALSELPLDRRLYELERGIRDEVIEGVDALLSQADELSAAHLKRLGDEAEKGPRLFSFAPVSASWRHPGWTKQTFRLVLYCEHFRLPVYSLGDQPNAGVYELEWPASGW